MLDVVVVVVVGGGGGAVVADIVVVVDEEHCYFYSWWHYCSHRSTTSLEYHPSKEGSTGTLEFVRQLLAPLLLLVVFTILAYYSSNSLRISKEAVHDLYFLL